VAILDLYLRMECIKVSGHVIFVTLIVFDKYFIKIFLLDLLTKVVGGGSIKDVAGSQFIWLANTGYIAIGSGFFNEVSTLSI